MRQLGTRLKKIKFGNRGEALVLEVMGYINAATFIDFEKHVKTLLEKQVRNVALDFGELEYINSSGMGLLLSIHDAAAKIGGRVCLVRVTRPIAQTLQMLGIPQVIPFLPDKNAMVRFFSGAPVAPAPAAKQPVKVESAGQALAARAVARPATPAAAAAGGPVLVLSPATNLFTDLIRLRFGRNAGLFHVLNDCLEAWTRFDQIKPDLVILEDSLPGADDLLSKIKTDRVRCHVSVIKVYPKNVDPRTKVPFKIWENDSLREPFELRELFALAEAERMRVPRDRAVALQQVHFTFTYSEDHLNRALGIGKSAIFSAAISEEKAVPLYAAFQEAIDNALRHGNRYDQRKRVDVTLLVSPEEIRITVEDEGRGFDSDRFLKLASELSAVARTRLAREEGKIGGLGIKLMRECADKIEYSERGRRIHLSKRIAPAAAPEPQKTATVAG